MQFLSQIAEQGALFANCQPTQVGDKGGHILPHPGCTDSQVTGQDSPWHVLLHLGMLASLRCPTDAADGFTVSSSTCPSPRDPQERAADWGAGQGPVLGSPEVHSTGANPGLSARWPF